jgi:hypothetical protein
VDAREIQTMSSKARVKVGIIGSGFEADIHAASFKIMPDEAEVVARYQSAGQGARVNLPFRPKGVERPIDLKFNPVE